MKYTITSKKSYHEIMVAVYNLMNKGGYRDFQYDVFRSIKLECFFPILYRQNIFYLKFIEYNFAGS
jgi:hypothetical protein